MIKNRCQSPRRLGRRGISLVELTISVALLGLVSLGVISLMSKPTSFVQDTSDKLDKSALADAQGATLVRNLSRSFPMRRGFFDCGDTPLSRALTVKNRLPGTLVPANFEVNQSFSFVTSVGASMGAIDSNDLILPGNSTLVPGSLVMLTLMNHSHIGGVFRVTGGDPDENRYEVELSGNIPETFGCSITGALSIAQLLAHADNKMGGFPTKTFRADLIQVVRYDVRNDPKDGQSLVEIVWPKGEADEVKETIVFDSYLGLSFEKIKWTPQQGNEGVHGNFAAGMNVRQTVQLGKRSLASQKAFRQIAYSTTDGGNVNPGVITARDSAQFRFPTCALLANPVRGMFHYDDDVYSDMYRIQAVVADAPTMAKVDVRLTSSGADGPLCWNEGDVTVRADNRLVFSAARGRSSVIAIGTGASAIICDTPPGSHFSGTLQYFHSNLNTVVRQPCSEASIPDTPIQYEYDGPPTQCKKSGEIRFGKLVLVGSSPPEPGPILFVAPNGCKWETGSFTDCQPNPSRGDLKRIRMGPFQIPGDPDPGIPDALPSTIPGSTDNNELDCV